MPPFTMKRSVFTLGRYLANTVRSFFYDKPETCSPFDYTQIRSAEPRLVDPPTEISRPYQLRRKPVPRYLLLHFIHRLPVEILAHIFVLGSEDDVMLPIAVSHVCRVWRVIAFRTPTLWRRISLSPPKEMWWERICRARACSLDVQLTPWYSTRSGLRHQFLDLHTIQWYLHLVVPFVNRWRSFELMLVDFAPFLSNAALSGLCSRSHRVQAPLLEDLFIVYRANDDTKEFCLFSGYAPRLRRVTLDGIRLTWLPSLFGNLSLLHYTHHGFTTGHQAVDEVLSMLEVSCRLIELRISFPRKPVPTIPPQRNFVRRRVLLPMLARLYLRVEDGDVPFELAHLMTLLSTPSLTTLRFIDLGRKHHSFHSLHPFFQYYTIPPSVRSLRLEHGWYNRHILSMLFTLPHIRQIIVRRPHVPDQRFDLVSRTKKGNNWGTGIYGHRAFNAPIQPIASRRQGGRRNLNV